MLNLNLKVAFCTRARTSNEVKISIEAARLACPESKDETHFLPLPVLVPIAEFDPANPQCVSCGMPVRTEMLCDKKTRGILVNASEMFNRTFPPSAPSLAGVNGRAATAGDAVNQTGRQASERILDGQAILWPQKIGFPGNMATSTATWVLTWISAYSYCGLRFCRVN